MKSSDRLVAPREVSPGFAIASSHAESFPQSYTIRGDVFLTLRDGKTGEVQDYREVRNLVVNDASILVARLMKDSNEPPHGAYALAVGTGKSGWDPQNPPAPTKTQRALYAEVARKVFSSTSFINAAGLPTTTPTNVVDFSTTFTESEAVGPLVEMGLVGGNVNPDLTVKNLVTPADGPYDPTVNMVSFDTLINALNFRVINKPATSSLGLVWRLTF